LIFIWSGHVIAAEPLASASSQAYRRDPQYI
jgi:hypothetical protein